MHVQSSLGSLSVLTSTHLKPSGAALGIVDLDHLAFLPSSVRCVVNKSHAARIKPIAASAINPQKMNVGTFINASPCSVADYSAAAPCGPSDKNGATLCSDSVVPGPGVRIPSKPRYSIQLTPFAVFNGLSGCHWEVVGSSGFSWAGGCRMHVFEAAASAFGAARRLSRAKSFPVQVVA